MNQKSGIALTELLIAAALLLLLLAATLPLLAGSQIRADVARARAEMRRLIAAGEAYQIDNGHRYMVDQIRANGQIQADMLAWCGLTTPVAYLASVAQSPFKELKNKRDGYSGSDGNDGAYFEYWSGNYRWINGQLVYVYDAGAAATGLYWRGTSVGPDQSSTIQRFGSSVTPYDVANRDPRFIASLYDPSNGTVSSGDFVFSNQRIHN